ncbi:MAG: ChaN family lipoprotein [Planctomycetota bacterium]|jgi:hypothetical protein|nr:ChaN family lipoprotein [Planctomycetota bacterium]
MGKGLELQRELWERVARQARRLGTAGRPSLWRAVTEFEASFPDTYRRLERQRFIERLASTPWLLIGDYHTLPRAQIVASDFVRDYKPACVAFEIIPASKQPELDAWAQDDRPAKHLLHELRFPESWGKLPTHGYEMLLETARAHGCRLLAVDHPSSADGQLIDFNEREDWMVDRLGRYADRPCLALLGDLHLHPQRVPAKLGDECTVLHQNHAPYHFALQEDCEGIPALLQIDSNRYVFQHTHPLLVEESCLVALSGENESHVASPDELLPDLLTRVGAELDVDAPQVPTVIATFEPDQRNLLQSLVNDEAKATALLDRLFIQGIAFLEETGPLVIHLPGSNHLAEAAGKWLVQQNCPQPASDAPDKVRLLSSLRLEAAGFVASLLVNPLRRGKSLSWYRDFLNVEANWKQTGAWHDRLQALLDGQSPGLPSNGLPCPEGPAGLVLARIVGQTLGQQLFGALQAGSNERQLALAALFCKLQNPSDVQPAIELIRRAIAPSAISMIRGTKSA